MLILLDIDGVMVPAAGWKAPTLLDDGFPAFHNRAVKALNRIIAATDAAIILTTSHKSKFSLEQWQQIFLVRGIKAQPSALPTAESWQTRRDEILTWAATNSTGENFVIVDDDKSLNNLSPALKSRLVLTSPLIGLTEEAADEAIRILRQSAVVHK